VVEGLGAEVEAADQRAHAAGGRVQRDKGRLHLRPLRDGQFGPCCTTRTTEPRRIASGALRLGGQRRLSPAQALAAQQHALAAGQLHPHLLGRGLQHDGHAQQVVVAVVLQRLRGGAFGARVAALGQGFLVLRAAPGLAAVEGEHALAHGGVRGPLVGRAQRGDTRMPAV
jgi:hypothetical protein